MKTITPVREVDLTNNSYYKALMLESSMLPNILLQQSRATGKPVVECLAELVKECLLSETDDPIHVSGLEFIRLIDEVLIK